MRIISTAIPDVKLIAPSVFQDARGYFFESFHAEKLREAGIGPEFVQDNQSSSGKHVLRGLHFQLPPYAQGKLVRLVRGAVIDVAVDLRVNSPWYGQHVAVELNDENRLMCWIPPGFAHGFITLAEENIFFYKCTAYYNKASEASIRWNDPDLKINWGISTPLLSEKDTGGLLFKNFSSPF